LYLINPSQEYMHGNKGKNFSTAHRKKLSDIRLKRKERLGFLISEKTRKKLSVVMKGKNR
jgi:hypothetical protein